MKIGKRESKKHGCEMFFIIGRIEGRRIPRKAIFKTPKEAMKAYAEMLTKANHAVMGTTQPPQKATLGDLLAIAEKEEAIIKRKRVLPTFRRFVTAIGAERRIPDLDEQDWAKFIERELKGKKPNTWNTYFGRIQTVLKLAKSKFAGFKQWAPPSAPYRPNPQGRTKIVENDELLRIIEGLNAPRQFGEHVASVVIRKRFIDLILLQVLTGAREGELLALDDSRVLWGARQVYLTTHKGGVDLERTRKVPLSDAAFSIVKKLSPNYFKGLTVDMLYNALRKAAEISGVAYGDRVFDGWVLHDMRHLAATIMEDCGLPYSAIAAILGHKRLDQTATYTQPRQATMRAGVEMLEKHFSFLVRFWPVSADNGAHALTSTDNEISSDVLLFL
jgi:integrase